MSQIQTVLGEELGAALVGHYFDSLVDRFFKILPLKEDAEPTLDIYIRSLQRELIGCKGLIPLFAENANYLSLLSILQSFVDEPNVDVDIVRREVFRAIRICKMLKQDYT